MIAEELNVKEVWFGEKEADLASLSAKPNFRKLGPRLGANVKVAAGEIQALGPDALEQLAEGGKVKITVNGAEHEIGPDDVVIERHPKDDLAVASEGEVVVALDVTVTEELAREGLAREFVNKVQNMRKTQELDVTDRITVKFAAGENVQKAVADHRDYIDLEILSVGTAAVDALDSEGTDWDLNGFPCTIAIEKAAMCEG